jgi:hypothetical protein
MKEPSDLLERRSLQQQAWRRSVCSRST